MATIPAAPARAADLPSPHERGVRDADRARLERARERAGKVTRFAVDAGFVARYPVRIVGASVHEESWVPAENLAEFNRHILGPIGVIASLGSAAAESNPRAALD